MMTKKTFEIRILITFIIASIIYDGLSTISYIFKINFISIRDDLNKSILKNKSPLVIRDESFVPGKQWKHKNYINT